MSEPIRFWDAVEEIRRHNDHFEPEAYGFVMSVLEHTIHELPERRHVTAVELLDGLRRYARERYGIMARTVIESWGLRGTSDIGTVVFQLVDAGVLSRRDTDSREDFADVFDLYDALEKDYFYHLPEAGSM